MSSPVAQPDDGPPSGNENLRITSSPKLSIIQESPGKKIDKEDENDSPHVSVKARVEMFQNPRRHRKQKRSNSTILEELSTFPEHLPIGSNSTRESTPEIAIPKPAVRVPAIQKKMAGEIRVEQLPEEPSQVWVPVPPRPLPLPQTRTRTKPPRNYPVRSSTETGEKGRNSEAPESFEETLNEHLQTYYQTGEGVGDVERLLSRHDEEHGPVRFSDDLITDDMCAHKKGRRRLSLASTAQVSRWGRCVCGEEKIKESIKFTFALVRHGKFLYSDPVPYDNPTRFDNNWIKDKWLVNEMRRAYNTQFGFSFFIPMSRICFARYIRMENLTKKGARARLQYPYPCTTAKIGFMGDSQGKSKTIFRRHFNYPEEPNRAAHRRIWLKKFDDIIQQVEGNAEFLIELDEEWNFWFFFWMLLLAIGLSATTAILYNNFTKDASAALTLASYIVTCLALLLALIAAGDYVGLHRPQTELNFDYNSDFGEFDMATGKVLEEQIDQNSREKLRESRRKAERRKADGGTEG